VAEAGREFASEIDGSCHGALALTPHSGCPDPFGPATNVIMGDQLKKIGINLELQQLEVTVWFDRYAKGDHQLTSAYWSGTIDPDNFYIDSARKMQAESVNAVLTSNHSEFVNDDLQEQTAAGK
jgi:ABC-type transport system substrate-binding protein